MRIEVKGRGGLAVTDAMQAEVTRRFEKIARQVSELAILEVTLWREADGPKDGRCVAEAAIALKGVTLRAREGSPDLKHSIHLVSDELHRQVKRDRDKRRNRRAGRVPEEGPVAMPTLPDGP
jgi:putative sigma-54 modulation protein